VEALRRVTEGYIETPWQVEKFGTWRSWHRPDRYLCPSRAHFAENPIMPYVGTGGIHRGKWLPYVRELFAENNLDVDFSKRGFYRPHPRIFNVYRRFLSIKRAPRAVFRAYFLGR
jgi:hypothetical protein